VRLHDLQNQIDIWIKEHGGYWSEFQILARLTEELGEVASELQREHGLRPKIQKTDVPGEVGDLLFTLIAFCNKKGISLDSELKRVLQKYKIRDAKAWKEKLDLPSLSSNTISTLNVLAEACSKVKTPQYTKKLREKSTKRPKKFPDDQGMMRHVCVAIAYSQNTQSKKISELIDTNVFRAAFKDFDSTKLSRAKPGSIISRYWHKLSAMRFKNKVERIVSCAKVIKCVSKEYGSFASYLNSWSIPRRIKRKYDFSAFWEGFDKLQYDLRVRKMPFFGSTTSLLQLLLDLDYDSVKPDLVIMRLGRRLGIVEKETGDKYFRTLTQQIQLYGLESGIRPPAVDLMMLTFGGQTGARDLLTEYYCPSKDPCSHSTCLLGQMLLCGALKKKA